MTNRVLLASLAVGTLAAPLPGPAAALAEPAIKEIIIRPVEPVVGPSGSVRLVIDVIARGAEGEDGVTIDVAPGRPPKGASPLPEPVISPEPDPTPPPQEPVTWTGGVEPSEPPSQPPSEPPSEPPSDPPPVSPSMSPGRSSGKSGDSPHSSPAQPVPDESPRPAHHPSPAASATPSPTGPSPSPSPSPDATRPDPAASHPTEDPAAATAARVAAAGPAPHAEPMAATVMRHAMAPGDWETWRFLPARGLNRFYPTGVWTITATARTETGVRAVAYSTFTLRRETRLTSVRAARVRGVKAVRLSGALNRVDPKGYTDYAPFAGTRLEILHRRPRSQEWTAAGTATTRRDGGFSRTVSGRARGWWQIRYTGSAHYAEKSSTVLKIGR
ncbi:hypothetical protein ACIBH1_09375 [Nonomuraea sp. NPDC050663]|uniref:hypothetical protein n=1 Tax=Nonomuraea sp. NPDC050663 TaxID=3364370 RepID=UPI0037934732